MITKIDCMGSWLGPPQQHLVNARLTSFGAMIATVDGDLETGC